MCHIINNFLFTPRLHALIFLCRNAFALALLLLSRPCSDVIPPGQYCGVANPYKFVRVAMILDIEIRANDQIAIILHVQIQGYHLDIFNRRQYIAIRA